MRLTRIKIVRKLTWEETARQMAAEPNSFAEWDITGSDGLDEHPWDHGTSRKPAEREQK